jgi:hypothetical protein
MATDEAARTEREEHRRFKELKMELEKVLHELKCPSLSWDDMTTSW